MRGIVTASLPHPRASAARGLDEAVIYDFQKPYPARHYCARHAAWSFSKLGPDKIYAERFTGETHLERTIVEAQIIVRNARGHAPR